MWHLHMHLLNIMTLSDSMSDKRMQHVKDCDVPVVKEEYLKEAALGAALLKIPTFKISPWGTVRHSACLDSVGGLEDESSFISSGKWHHVPFLHSDSD